MLKCVKTSALLLFVVLLQAVIALMPGRLNPLTQLLLHSYTVSPGNHHLGQILNMVESESMENGVQTDQSCSPSVKQQEASLEVLRALSDGEHHDCTSTVRHHIGQPKDAQGWYNILFSRDDDKVVGKATLFVNAILQSSRLPDSVFAVVTMHGYHEVSVPLIQDGARQLCLAFDLSCVFHHQQTQTGEARFPISVDIMCRYGKGDYQPCGFRLLQTPFVIVHYFHREGEVVQCEKFSPSERMSCVVHG